MTDGTGPDDARLAKMLATIAEAQALVTSLTVLLRDVQHIGTEGTTSAAGLTETFIRLWEAHDDTDAHYSRDAMGRDVATMKRLLKANPPEVIHAKMAVYFASSDRFTQDQGYSLTLFGKRFNGLRLSSTETRPVRLTSTESAEYHRWRNALGPRVSACTHSPACETQDDHEDALRRDWVARRRGRDEGTRP